MLFDIRTAALDDLVDQRVRLAVSLLGAYRLRARLSAWDGTRCHLLIASADDAYGRQAIELAHRRGTAVLALGEPDAGATTPAVSSYTTASALAKYIRDCLNACQPEVRDKRAAKQRDTTPALCRLAQAPLRGTSVIASSNGRVLHLRPKVGRVYAATHSDLLNVADSLSSAEWSLAGDSREDSMLDQVSASLESFLMRAAWRAADELPPFPDGRYRLDAWPDLGALPSLVGALQIARALIGNNRSTGELAGSDGNIDRTELNACLWAFAAADLLRDVDPLARPMEAPKRRMASGVWANLARRFGLVRGSAAASH